MPQTTEGHSATTSDAIVQVTTASGPIQAFGARPTSENLVWSPVSAYVALAMLTEGASGETQNLLTKALDLKSPEALSALLSQMVGPEVTISDAVFLRQGLQAAPAFNERARRLYGAEALPLLSAEQVNTWVAGKTKDRIKKLFDRLSPSDAAVLVNAVTFDGKWARPFAEELTRERPFRSTGEAKSVPMMTAKRKMGYAEDGGVKMVSLPYEGGRYEMLAWLPRDGDKPDPYLDIKAWRERIQNREVDLLLPKWEMRLKTDLRPLLEQIGLASIFQSGDFTRLIPTGELAQIGAAVQEAWIQVDESGTKAAAATGLVAVTSAVINPQPPAVFHADRPFAYAIVHSPTNTPLFVGTVDHFRG